MTTGTLKSHWLEHNAPTYNRLTTAQKFDAVVIGGGITGLSAAYFLKKAGKRVCLLEKETLGLRDTGQTTAHLTYVIDERLTTLVKKFGKEQAALIWHSGMAAIDWIERIVAEHRIDCNFHRTPGYLHAALGSSRDESEDFKEEADLANELGFDVEFTANVPLVNKPGYRVRDQARFHPIAYIAGLAKLVHGDGSVICEHSEATAVDDDNTVTVDDSIKLDADYVVIATHVPLVGKSSIVKAALFQTKLASYTSYVVSARIPKDPSNQVLLWDTNDPYYYFRIDEDGESDRVIFGGSDQKTGQEVDTELCYRDLEERLAHILPSAVVDKRWCGQVVGTPDAIPFIGETASRQFVATGFNGNGMTFGTLAGLMARDAMMGRENPWQDLYSVARKPIRSGMWDYIRENIDYPYYMIADSFTSSKKIEAVHLQLGDGEVVRIDGKRVACSRDKDGRLQKVSAICTHMGCVVRWNRSDQTWDCPCHGSRFSPNGEVISGPAESPLEKVVSSDKSVE